MRHYKPGDVFGRLTILEIVSHPKNPKAKCRCACGAIVTPQLGALGIGKAKSCGCLGRENLIAAVRTHGQTSTPEYKTYKGLVSRCNNPRNIAFHNYGARGIQCLWNSFEEFFVDMGPRPPGAWIDRLNNDGPYCKANCAWVTPRANQANKRTSKSWTLDGMTFGSSVEAAKFLGVDKSVINRRCNGFTKGGVYHPPLPGCSCKPKYETPPTAREAGRPEFREAA